jgi:NAD(P)-dependent dehydrogenase (short-subunit alcohol dehydrogenase family)
MRNVLITGCGSGFGHLLAVRLARGGDRVFATVRDASTGQDLAALAREEELALIVRELDVTDPASVQAAVAEAEAQCDGLDVLVNNAGVSLRGPLETVSDDEVQGVLEVNLLGALRTIRAVVPGMRERGGGVIVNVSSLAGRIGVPYEGTYALSKFALEGMSEALSWELASAGIRLAIIEPGRHETQLFAKMRSPRAFGEDHRLRAEFDAFWEAVGRTVLSGEAADPQDVVDAICEAIDDPNTPPRRLVGADAEGLLALRRERTDSEFIALMRQTLGLPGAAPSAARETASAEPTR